MKRFSLFFACLFLINTTSSFAQSKFFATVSEQNKLSQALEQSKNIKNAHFFRLDESSLRNHLQNAPLEFHNNGVTIPTDIPLPNGTTETFGLVESPVLSPEQAALHPEIKTYSGNGLKDKKASIRISLTSSGFNAIVLNVDNDAVYFEKATPSVNDPNLYFSYFSRDATIPKEKKRASDGCAVGVTKSKTGFDLPINITSRLAPENNTGANLRTIHVPIQCGFHAGQNLRSQLASADRVKGDGGASGVERIRQVLHE